MEIAGKKTLYLNAPVIQKQTLLEELSYKIGPAAEIEEELQQIIKECCAEYPSIQKAWLNPAVIEGTSTLLLTIIGDKSVDLTLLMKKISAFSASPFTLTIVSGEDGMKDNPPLYIQGCGE
ncbi:MAG: hypothetical protein V8T90_04980 [Victivallales bacterium]